MSANDETKNYSTASMNRDGTNVLPVGGFIQTVIGLELATKHQIETMLSELPETLRANTLEVAKQLRKKQILTPLQAKNITDVKPQNLLIDSKGHVKILDLGLARIAADIAQSRELTASGTVMGTADYMAPEQASDAKNVDHRADIYALGCTLYRILTGRAPFETDSMVNTLVAHRTKPIPSLKAARPDVPDALEQLYQKMMAKRPEDRIGSMTKSSMHSV